MAVFTDIEKSDLEEFLSLYDIGRLKSFDGISDGIQNSNFIVETDQDKFILTIYEDERIFDSLDFFFAFKEHLSKNGVPCAAAIKSTDGKILNSLKNKPAAIVNFLGGKWKKTIKTPHCKEVGKYSALMHVAADDFDQRREYPHANDLLFWYNKLKEEGADVDSMKRGLSAEIEESHEYIISNLPANIPSGVIHGDLFPDNILFEGDKVSGVIDFYMAHNDFYIADLANTLTQWCFEHQAEFNITKAKAMLSAYNEIRKLSDEELKALPIFAAAAAMKWFLTRLYVSFNPPEGSLVNSKDPLEQLEKLRFHVQVKTVAEYGL